jgi:hypothetical protein
MNRNKTLKSNKQSIHQIMRSNFVYLSQVLRKTSQNHD